MTQIELPDLPEGWRWDMITITNQLGDRIHLQSDGSRSDFRAWSLHVGGGGYCTRSTLHEALTTDRTVLQAECAKDDLRRARERLREAEKRAARFSE